MDRHLVASRRRFAVVVSTLLALAGCGSGSTTDAGTDVPTNADVTGTTDAAMDAADAAMDATDAGLTCPTTMPADGDPCAAVPLQCEYGGFDWYYCNATATCTTRGWSVAPPLDTTCAPNNTMCPATAAAITRGGSCPSGINCLYREATCACVPGADAGLVWVCGDPTDSSCPTPRPLLGQPCDHDGQQCDYSSCGPGAHNIKEACRNGVWSFVFTECDGG